METSPRLKIQRSHKLKTVLYIQHIQVHSLIYAHAMVTTAYTLHGTFIMYHGTWYIMNEQWITTLGSLMQLVFLILILLLFAILSYLI